MKYKLVVALAVASFAALGCADAENDADTTADTALVPGQETVDIPTTVPTTDTVVRTTETDVDTIEGEPRDTIRR